VWQSSSYMASAGDSLPPCPFAAEALPAYLQEKPAELSATCGMAHSETPPDVSQAGGSGGPRKEEEEGGATCLVRFLLSFQGVWLTIDDHAASRAVHVYGHL
jgi:hypothetical protein